MDDCFLICDNKIVVTLPPGCNLVLMLLVLIGFCHVFSIKYASEVQDVMEFFQSKLLGLSEKTKHGVQYNNFFRELSYQQQILPQKKDDDEYDDDETQLDNGYANTQVSLFDVSI